MEDTLFPAEHRLALLLNGRHEHTFICTGEALPELVAGYLYNQGFISRPAGILYQAFSWEMDSVSIRTAAPAPAEAPAGEPFARRGYAADYIAACAGYMGKQARLYAQTGGMHCTAMFDGLSCLSLFEDIGRSNTLDKVCGDLLLRGGVAAGGLLITTGRLSSALMRKVIRMEAAHVATFSVPTQDALLDAWAANITVSAYLKSGEPRVISPRGPLSANRGR